MTAPYARAGTGFGAEVREGSAAHVYLLKRRRWREAYLRWLASGRAALLLEPTPEPWPSDRVLSVPADIA